MSLDPHVERVINWRESFVVLPDSHFFELIRMYLGEIHSPFNKQKLVEQLGAFLRKAENQKTIISLLSESDVQLLAAVKFIENTTQEKLASFFHGTFTFTQLYERLLNLEERLLIYRYADKKMNRQIIAINPMLEDVLAPYLTIDKILYKAEIAKVNFDVNTALSPELIASFISFVNKNKDLCKADGSLKKRTATEAQKFFGERTELLQALTTAFINLSLLIETPDGFEINQGRLKSFAELDDEKQYAYLCVASHGHFSRSALVRQAHLLIDTAFAAGDAGFTREVIVRNALLISEKQNDAPGVSSIGGTSRFAQMMAARAQAESRESVVNNAAEGNDDGAQVMDRLFETAVMMGFFDHKGRTDDGKDVFVTGYFLKNRAVQNPNSAGGAKVLSLDAAFNVTVMPGLKLQSLIPLVSFMDLKQFDTAAVFEINKKSVMRSFDSGMTQEKIFKLLSDYSAYEIPQNITVSINDWNSSYSSANLYKGYILQVNKDNARIVENNPSIAPHISKVLTEGIYLLDVLDDEEMKNIIDESGLDFIGKVKETERRNEGAAFPDFRYEIIKDQPAAEQSLPLSTDEDRSSHFDAMRNALEAINMGPEQKDGLLLRIRRKIVLNPEQLKPESVHFERIEAGGMDFSGKLHIIEGAITSNSLVEIEYEDKRINDGKVLQVIGKPLAVEKHEYDSSVRMLLQPDNVEQTFSISHATFVKKVRGSILK